MNIRFIATALATSLLNLLLHAAAHTLVLGDFYRAHPAGSPEFVRELQRSTDELVVWAMVVTALTMGTFITTVMQWSGAATRRDGITRGALLGLLFWTSINSGLYASSRMFSLPSVLLDTLFSALSMAISAAFSAWMLHRLRRGTGRHDA